jgi:hypothetical protein
MLYTSLSRCSGQYVTLIGTGWDNAFDMVTPKSRFDAKLKNTVIQPPAVGMEEPAVSLIE